MEQRCWQKKERINHTMSSLKKYIVLFLSGGLLSGCALLQAITGESDNLAPTTTSVTCPINEEDAYSYSRAQEAYLRLSERWWGRTMQRQTPDIRAALQRRVDAIYSHARTINPCLQGTIDWLLIFNNDGTVTESHLLWSSPAIRPLEFELRQAISDLRLLPIAAPRGSVYLLPITLQADATHGPTLNVQDFILK